MKHLANRSVLQKLASTAAVALLVAACQTNSMSGNNEYSDVSYYSFTEEGLDYDRLGMHEDAQMIYRSALADDPENLNTLSNIALSKLLAGDSIAAETILQKVVASPDATVQHRTNLALVYGVRDKMNAARLLLSEDLEDHEVDQNLAMYTKIQADPSLLSAVVFPPFTEEEQVAFNQRAAQIQASYSVDTASDYDTVYNIDEAPMDFQQSSMGTNGGTVLSLEPAPYEPMITDDEIIVDQNALPSSMPVEMPAEMPEAQTSAARPTMNSHMVETPMIDSALQDSAGDVFIVEPQTVEIDTVVVQSPPTADIMGLPPVGLPEVPASVLQRQQDTSGM